MVSTAGVSPSAEAVLLFAFVKAHCVGLKPRQRVAFLHDVAAILTDLENRPPSVRSPDTARAVGIASGWFKDELPRLLA